MFKVIFLVVLVKFFVEFSKDVGNSFSRCDAFTIVVFYLCVGYFLLCWFDSRVISYTFELTLQGFFGCLVVSSFFFFSDTLFEAFTQIFNSLFLFVGCASPLLDESQESASLFGKSSVTVAAADAITRASLLSFLNSLALLLEWNTIEPASSSWCGTCASRYSSELCSGWIITFWALFRQSLSCQHVAAAAAATSCVYFLCSFCIFDFVNRVWALFLQSHRLSLHHHSHKV